MDEKDQEVTLEMPVASAQLQRDFLLSGSALLAKFGSVLTSIFAKEAGCANNMVSTLDLTVVGGGLSSRYRYDLESLSLPMPQCTIQLLKPGAESIQAQFTVQGPFSSGFYYQVDGSAPKLLKASNALVLESQTYTASIPRPNSLVNLEAGISPGINFSCDILIGPDFIGKEEVEGECQVKAKKSNLEAGECTDVTLELNGEQGTPTLLEIIRGHFRPVLREIGRPVSTSW